MHPAHPWRREAAREGGEEPVAEIREDDVVLGEGATDEAADIAAGPAERRRRHDRRRLGGHAAEIGRMRRDSQCKCKKGRRAQPQGLFGHGGPPQSLFRWRGYYPLVCPFWLPKSHSGWGIGPVRRNRPRHRRGSEAPKRTRHLHEIHHARFAARGVGCRKCARRSASQRAASSCEASWSPGARPLTISSTASPTSPSPSLDSCFTTLPLEYLHHDDRINPHSIGANVRGLIEELLRRRPQLHVGLAWRTQEKDGAGAVKVFDG